MSFERPHSAPWPLDFDRPKEGPPLFHQAIEAALDSVSPDTSGSFAMVPNFRFNHTGFRPTRVDELYLGSLTVARHSAPDRVAACQQDSTSGERWALTLAGGGRLLRPGSTWKVEASAEGNRMAFDGWMEEDGADRLIFSRVQNRPRLLSRVPAGRAVMHRQMLFLGLRELEGTSFDVTDLTHGYEPALRLHQVDTAMQRVGGMEIELSCHVLAGPNSIPTYWWVDPADRVVAMSGILWTYVLINPDRLS